MIMQYSEKQEATEISYVKIGNNNKNLIVSFAGNGHDGFERKTSGDLSFTQRGTVG